MKFILNIPIKTWTKFNTHMQKKINLDPYFIPYSNINSNLITGLNIKVKTINGPGENICFFEVGTQFLIKAQKVQAIKEKFGVHQK